MNDNIPEIQRLYGPVHFDNAEGYSLCPDAEDRGDNQLVTSIPSSVTCRWCNEHLANGKHPNLYPTEG